MTNCCDDFGNCNQCPHCARPLAANFERALLKKSLDVLTCSYTNDDEMNAWHKQSMDVIAEIREALAAPHQAQPEHEHTNRSRDAG